MYILQRTMSDGQIDYYGLYSLNVWGRTQYLNWTPFLQRAARISNYENAVKAAIRFTQVDGLNGLRFKVVAIEHPILASILE